MTLVLPIFQQSVLSPRLLHTHVPFPTHVRVPGIDLDAFVQEFRGRRPRGWRVVWFLDFFPLFGGRVVGCGSWGGGCGGGGRELGGGWGEDFSSERGE